ncbi:Phosphofurin acidic cluster sorting protein [Echinococcus granulosus]|uniref:Phosphofurin acidic cluster sorting protein n=1 Tax=Echinococcus granulosus TaxID=6210 RepID=W6V4I2_ECHGR|nr:Phosphofurin acidic cluster sorting protein [Echinococcus granulosus]EUB61054.1 Phosphofurin acidic cluster sorting protein [Echinococcus granulosus]
MSATWEVEKSSSCSVRRLCHIQMGQIILDRPIDLGENASGGVHVALRMRGNTRRILRSPEISLVVPKHPSTTATANSATRGAGAYIPIDLNCTIQYSHVLKMDSNILQILLQKRKKYKNTTMNLGYKTLAYCNISLSQVLQRRIEHRFLSMYPNPKCIGPAIARIEVHCLSTLPWERDPINPENKEVEFDGCLEDGCLLPADVFSDDADEDSDSEEEVDMEDVDTGRCGQVGGVSSTSASTAIASRGGQKKVLKSMSVGQIKQKVISLLKRLKVADPNEEIDTGTTLHLWEEIDKMETVSDVDEDSDLDTGATAESGSLQSVPRPSIRPFFGHTGSSEETLSLDAGARLLRRLQKEALLTSDPLPSRQATVPPSPAAAITGPFNESSTTTMAELRRQTTATTGGGRGGVKFPPCFGPIKTRRTMPTAKRRQVTPSSPMAATPVPSKTPPFLNGHHEGGGRSHVENPAIFNLPTANDVEPLEYWRTEDEPSGSMVHTGGSTFPESLADVQFVVNILEPGGKAAATALAQAGCAKLARVSSFQEVRQVLSSLVSWVQMHHVEDGRREIRFCVVGGDALLNSVLRAFVEVAGARSEAVAAAFRFFLVPVSGLLPPLLSPQQQQHLVCRHRRSISSTLPPLSQLSSDLVQPTKPGSPSISRESHPPPVLPSFPNLVAQRLCSLDPCYARLFSHLAVGEGVSEADATASTPTPVQIRRVSTEGGSLEGEFVRRVVVYLTTADCLLPLPIGECLVAGSHLDRREDGIRDRKRESQNRQVHITDGSHSPLFHDFILYRWSTCMDMDKPGTLTTYLRFFQKSPIHCRCLERCYLGRIGNGSATYRIAKIKCSTWNDDGSSLDEESGKQTLVPFLLCIRLGGETILRGCLGDGSEKHGTAVRSSGPGAGAGDYHPPGAPHLTPRSPSSSSTSVSSPSPTVFFAAGSDKPTYELQLEYWALNAPGSTSAAGSYGGSSSLVHPFNLDDRGGSIVSSGGSVDGRVVARPVTFKAVCRSMLVGLTSSPLCAPIPLPQKPSTLLNLAMITREKKPKIMRIGKKTSKEVTFKPDLIEGVTRLICTCKGIASHASVAAESMEAGLGLTPVGRCADIAPPPPSSPKHHQLSLPPPHLSTGEAAAAVGESTAFCHPSTSFSVRDDLSCGLIVPGQSTSSSGDHVFVRISIDGVDWPTSRFFQVAPGWRTHVKVFPLVCMSPLPSSPAFALPLAKVMVGLSGHAPPPTSLLLSATAATSVTASAPTQAPAITPS